MRYHPMLIMGFAVAITSGCGYHLRGTINPLPPEMNTMTLNSYDPYGLLTRFVRSELHLNNVNIIDATNNSKTMLSLQIMKASESQATTSVFPNGKTAEYQITLDVQAHVLIPGKNYYPIDVKVNSAFFNNPMTALAQDAEMNIIRQELHQQLAKQLVRKLLMLPIA